MHQGRKEILLFSMLSPGSAETFCLFFLTQVLAQIELQKEHNSGKYKNKVYVLPKQLDEKVAALHLKKLGATLTRMTEEQVNILLSVIRNRFMHFALPLYYCCFMNNKTKGQQR